jgi:hypothetical protein
MDASGVMSPRPFHLDSTANGTVVVHLHPAYTAWHVGGALAIVAGIGEVLIGLPGVALGDPTCGPAPVRVGSGPPCGVAVGIVLGVGAALIASGTVALVNNGATTVSQDDGAQAPAPARAPESDWYERREVRAESTSFGAPIVTLRF